MSSNNQMAEATGQLPQVARPPLLITESADEYAALLAALRQDADSDLFRPGIPT